MKVFLSDSALDDLERIQGYYKNEGIPHIGDEFVTSILEHIQTLRDHQDIGRIVPEFAEKKIRELIHPPFRIVYLREQRAINIVRIWRSERLLILPESESK